MLCQLLLTLMLSAFASAVFSVLFGGASQATPNLQDGHHSEAAMPQWPGPDYVCDVPLPGTAAERPRTTSDSSIGATAYAYPSAGGVVFGAFTAIQLKQLGLSNLEEALRSDADEEAYEDRLSVAMLQQGAQWWPAWGLYTRHRGELSQTPYDFHFPPKVYVAYPSDDKGVWVLKYSADQGWEREDDVIKPSLPWEPDGLKNRLRLALTADEACLALKHFGAT